MNRSEDTKRVAPAIRAAIELLEALHQRMLTAQLEGADEARVLELKKAATWVERRIVEHVRSGAPLLGNRPLGEQAYAAWELLRVAVDDAAEATLPTHSPAADVAPALECGSLTDRPYRCELARGHVGRCHSEMERNVRRMVDADRPPACVAGGVETAGDAS